MQNCKFDQADLIISTSMRGLTIYCQPDWENASCYCAAPFSHTKLSLTASDTRMYTWDVHV